MSSYFLKKYSRELTVLSNQSLDLDCTKFSADEKLDRLAIHLRIHDVKANSFSEIIFKIFKCLKKKADRTFNVLNTHLYPNPAFDYAKHYQMYLIAKIVMIFHACTKTKGLLFRLRRILKKMNLLCFAGI